MCCFLYIISIFFYEKSSQKKKCLLLCYVRVWIQWFYCFFIGRKTKWWYWYKDNICFYSQNANEWREKNNKCKQTNTTDVINKLFRHRNARSKTIQYRKAKQKLLKRSDTYTHTHTHKHANQSIKVTFNPRSPFLDIWIFFFSKRKNKKKHNTEFGSCIKQKTIYT